MNFDTVSNQQLNEVERLTGQLLTILKKAKLQHEPLAVSLRQLEVEAGNVRCARFDAANPRYQGY